MNLTRFIRCIKFAGPTCPICSTAWSSDTCWPAAAIASSPHTAHCLSLPEGWRLGLHTDPIMSVPVGAMAPKLYPTRPTVALVSPTDAQGSEVTPPGSKENVSITEWIWTNEKEAEVRSHWQINYILSLVNKPNKMFWGIVDAYCLLGDVPGDEQPAVSS